jgi:2-methylcitrate dehydratase PrpD
MVKHGIAMGAMVGVMAARLASLGYTGPPSLLEHGEYAAWVGDIGDAYILPTGVTWKEWSCCAWTHPALRALRDLKRAHQFTAEQVKTITIVTHHYAKRLGVRLPSTTEEAQFNLAWPVAVFLVDGEVGPRQVLEEGLGRTDVRDLAGRVEVLESDRLTRLYAGSESSEPGAFEAAEVAVTLDDGRVLQSGEVCAPEYGSTPWSRQKAQEKFEWLVSGVVGAETAKDLAAAACEVESMPDVRRLTQSLSEAVTCAGRKPA